LNDNVQRTIHELLNLDIIEKVSGPTTWVNPAVLAPNYNPNNYDVCICVDIGVPTKSKLLRDETTVVGRLVMRGMRIVVPLSLLERVLELA